ncbi:hypothetical protein WL18_22785 [Burkholderia ubonensis]|nr:hypothetical protein WL18_22785 [Burkholderia ubonensis]
MNAGFVHDPVLLLDTGTVRTGRPPMAAAFRVTWIYASTRPLAHGRTPSDKASLNPLLFCMMAIRGIVAFFFILSPFFLIVTESSKISSAPIWLKVWIEIAVWKIFSISKDKLMWFEPCILEKFPCQYALLWRYSIFATCNRDTAILQFSQSRCRLFLRPQAQYRMYLINDCLTFLAR